MKNDSLKEFQPGQIVWFYYDDLIFCQKGEIGNYVNYVNKVECYYDIRWIMTSYYTGKEIYCGTSVISSNRIFETQEECLAYAKSISNNNKDKIKKSISSKEELLQFMFDCINNDCTDEKDVIREKIKEYFGFRLE